MRRTVEYRNYSLVRSRPELRRSILQFKSKHPLSRAIAGGIIAPGSSAGWNGRGEGRQPCFGTSRGIGHVSSPRVRHVCISWDTVVKPSPPPLPGPCSPPAFSLSPFSPASEPSLPRENPFSPARGRSRGSAEPDVRGQRGPNCRQSYVK